LGRPPERWASEKAIQMMTPQVKEKATQNGKRLALSPPAPMRPDGCEQVARVRVRPPAWVRR
jgi:hypothetical protein